jgi:hypothetical protein
MVGYTIHAFIHLNVTPVDASHLSRREPTNIKPVPTNLSKSQNQEPRFSSLQNQ